MAERNKRPGEVWMLLKDRKMLARLMAIQGKSARGLATDSGFKSHTYLQRMLRGEVSSCTAERAVAIAANLQVPLDSLFLSHVSTGDGQSSSSDRPFQGAGPKARRRTARAHSSRRGPRMGARGKTDAA